VSSRHSIRAVRARIAQEGSAIIWENNGPERGRRADVAQVVERLTCNQQVVGSTPTIGSMLVRGTDAERCPSGQREQTVNLPANAFGGSNPPLSTVRDGMGRDMRRGSSSVGRARAFQARGRGFDSRLPLVAASVGMTSDDYAHVAQTVEHFLGKEEVTGSNPVMGSGMRA
jgi:hypothetical protein